MEKESYEFMNSVMVVLLDMDHLNTYDYLATELHVSKSTLSAIKQGKDIRLHYYLLAISYMMEQMCLTISMTELEKQIRKALAENRDLVIGTIPHQAHGNSTPEDWKKVMEWK